VKDSSGEVKGGRQREGQKGAHARGGWHDEDNHARLDQGGVFNKLVGQASVLAKGRIEPNHKLVASRQLPCKITSQRNLRGALYTLEEDLNLFCTARIQNMHKKFQSFQATQKLISTALVGCREGQGCIVLCGCSSFSRAHRVCSADE